jgi:type II secretory pathway predicted ATPase ExeA
MYQEMTEGGALPEPAREAPTHMETNQDTPLVELIQPSMEHEQATEHSDQLDAVPGDFVDFYGLSENPFSDAVNPLYFYKTDLHEETYIRMMLAVRHNISLGLVTGASGTGKTLVSQLVLQNLDLALYNPVLVLVTPGMSKTALLREILNELELPVPAGPFVATRDLLKILGEHVMQLHSENRKLVILIDECHFLSAESLHILRTLSNIEVPDRKLLTCLLFAEDRFMKRLEHPSYESLRNRMYLRSQLMPLSPDECAQYVKYRLIVAGRPEPLFDPEALDALYTASGGISRQINKLGMLCLLEGFLRKRQTIHADIVTHCAAQM